MKNLIVSETIRSSRDMFYEHVWVTKQINYSSHQYKNNRRFNSNRPPINQIPCIEPVASPSVVRDLLSELRDNDPFPPLDPSQPSYPQELDHASAEANEIYIPDDLCPLDNNFTTFSAIGNDCGHRYCREKFCKDKKHSYAIVNSAQVREHHALFAPHTLVSKTISHNINSANEPPASFASPSSFEGATPSTDDKIVESTINKICNIVSQEFPAIVE